MTRRLKNEAGILPLDPAKIKNVAVLGWADGLHIITTGGGGGAVSLWHPPSGPGVRVDSAPPSGAAELDRQRLELVLP